MSQKVLSLCVPMAASLVGCATMPGMSEAPLNPESGKSGATLTESQQSYDVRHYDIQLEVLPQKQRIAGTVTVELQATAALSQVDLDLEGRLKVSAAQVNGEPARFVQGVHNISVFLPTALQSGGKVQVSVTYSGSPYVAERPPWQGGFIWSETADGQPWIATAVQGRGCDLWWPCKDFYGDKPDDGLDITVTVPQPLVVAANGKLVDQTTTDGKSTFHWQSNYPFTNYLVALNIGPYEIISDSYESVFGNSIPIQFYALKENVEKARKIIETDVKPHLAFYEDLLGPYPWPEDKVGFVETPHLGMEHQTINAYGEGYKRGKYAFDGLLHHELAHEWFGNLVTHTASKDVWIHEGYGAYMQALYAEQVIGDMAYDHAMYETYLGLQNCQAVVRDLPEVEAVLGNGDVYGKAAWMLHTLRWWLGEDVWVNTTRRLLYGTKNPTLDRETSSIYRSTEEFISILSEEAGRDMSGIVETYLFEPTLPELLSERDGNVVTITWQVTGDRSFDVPVPVRIGGNIRVIDVSGGTASFAVPPDGDFQIDPEMRVLRQLPIIGDCAEQTEKRKKRIAERTERMAKEYRWTKKPQMTAD